jgi:diazepam-binding inhibitor (GABA receptor modulating acyl-CoA-binding protein)
LIQKLKIYALYKQSTEGDAPEQRPWAIEIIKRAKWESWNSLRHMTKIEAMKQYIAAVKDIR